LIVVDTNVVAYLLLPGPQTQLAEALRRHDRQWAVPPLWRSEFRNVLTQHVRRDLLDLTAALALMHKAEGLLAAHEQPVASQQVLHLVSISSCSSYDCEFVAAAHQLEVPLITEDRAILKAFPTIAKPLHQATS
jgi:predicted nucleic acid-binding protein